MSAPGTTKVVTFTITNTQTDALYDPAKVVVLAGLIEGDEIASPLTYTYGTDPEVVRVSAGVYEAQIPCSDGGEWGARLEARKLDDTLQGAFEKYWRISESRIV